MEKGADIARRCRAQGCKARLGSIENWWSPAKTNPTQKSACALCECAWYNSICQLRALVSHNRSLSPHAHSPPRIHRGIACYPWDISPPAHSLSRAWIADSEKLRKSTYDSAEKSRFKRSLLSSTSITSCRIEAMRLTMNASSSAARMPSFVLR